MSDLTKKVEEVVDEVKDKVTEEAKKLTDVDLNKAAGGIIHSMDWNKIKGGSGKN